MNGTLLVPLEGDKGRKEMDKSTNYFLTAPNVVICLRKDEACFA